MQVNDKSWIAGFYEGEGSIGCYIRKPRKGLSRYTSYQFHVNISQTNLAILKHIKTLLGYGTIGRMNRKNSFGRRPLYGLYISNDQCLDFVELIRPYMRCSHKIQQMDRAVRLRGKYRKLRMLRRKGLKPK